MKGVYNSRFKKNGEIAFVSKKHNAQITMNHEKIAEYEIY